MIKLKQFALIAILMVGFTAASAQEVAHIDALNVINLMPETKAAEAEIKKMLTGHEAEIKKMEAELTKMQEDFQAKYANLKQADITPAIQQEVAKIQKEAGEKAERLGQYRETAAEEVSSTRDRLLKPIEKKVQDAINSAAAKKGVKYVLNQASLLYYNGGYNLLEDVKKELGL